MDESGDDSTESKDDSTESESGDDSTESETVIKIHTDERR